MISDHVIIKKRSLCFFVLTAVIAMAAYCMKLSTICFAIAMTQVLAIVCTAKISIFSLFAILINFCFIQEYAAYIGVEVYGLLGVSTVPIYFFEMFICIYTFNIGLYMVLTNSNCLNNESELFKEKLDIGYAFSIILSLLAIIITILIFPTVPSLISFSSTERFNSGIISFVGWSCIPYFFLAVAIINKKANKFVMLVSAFVVIWYVFHGERVDCIGFLALFAIKYFNEHPGKKAIVKEIIGALILGLVFVGVGILRSGAKKMTMGDLFQGLLIQSTACDVTYVFNCSVDLAEKGTAFHGVTYLSYIINCVPLLPDSYSFQTYIHKFYYTAGGGLFFAEPVANFGIGFACIFSCFYIALLVSIIKKRSRYRYMIYATLCITVFRSAWYGLNYPITTILYFAPAVLIAYNLMTRKQRKRL